MAVMIRKTKSTLPEVNFSEDGDIRYLHLATPWIQGSMWIAKPYDIELEYVQRMMAGLLFWGTEAVAGGHAMQLGLGAATLTKFCYKKLGMTCTAIEINPGVLHACRGWFKLPADDERLRVVIADAGEEIQRDEWTATVDLLHVDLYDHEAASPVLDSVEFYDHCKALLTPEGCMTVNLFGRSSSYERSLEKIAQVFREDAVWAFKPTREGNTIVLAQRTPQHPSRDALQTQAEAIEKKFGWPAVKWLKVFKPLVKY
jgi:spermidine synthase